jgi:hypothetical protein
LEGYTVKQATALGLATSLVAGIVLCVAKNAVAQVQQDARAVSMTKVNMVLLSIEVTDSKGNYISGLQPKDFRILEDGIVQKLNTFGDGNNPPVQVLEDGNTRPFSSETWQKQVEAFESLRASTQNAYSVTYYPAQNPNEGFRKIDVQIVSDLDKKYRVRHKPGYRPR